MKQITLSVFAFLFATATFAQQRHTTTRKEKEKQEKEQREEEAKKHKFFVAVAIGYAFPNAGAIYDINGNPYSGSATFTNNGTAYDHFKVKEASLSSGLVASLRLRYMLNDHWGVAVVGDFGVAPTKYTYNGTQASIGGILGDQKVVQYAKMPVILSPSVYMQTNGKKLNLFARAGVALGVSTRVNYEETDQYTDPNVSNEKDQIFYHATSKLAVGFSGAMGVAYKLNDRCKVFAEASILSMAVYPDELKLTSALVNGQPQNITGTSPVKLGLTGSTSGTTTPNMTDGIPFSNIGINVGISYGL